MRSKSWDASHYICFLGNSWRFQGLGLTGFYNYGYGNTTPDTASIPRLSEKGPKSVRKISRIAALMHYTAEQWGLAGEFDYGNNAFSAGNLFSGAGQDEFGSPTGKAVTGNPISGNSCSPPFLATTLTADSGAQTGAWNALLNNGQARRSVSSTTYLATTTSQAPG